MKDYSWNDAPTFELDICGDYADILKSRTRSIIADSAGTEMDNGRIIDQVLQEHESIIDRMTEDQRLDILRNAVKTEVAKVFSAGTRSGTWLLKAMFDGKPVPREKFRRCLFATGIGNSVCAFGCSKFLFDDAAHFYASKVARLQHEQDTTLELFNHFNNMQFNVIDDLVIFKP